MKKIREVVQNNKIIYFYCEFFYLSTLVPNVQKVPNRSQS